MTMRWAMAGAGTLLLVWSAIGAADYPTWLFEVGLGFVGMVILVAIYPRFRFTDIVYLFALLHFAVLAIGGKYTYTHAPPGEWLQELFQWERNPFDRLGHFMQGFVPALIAREVFLRKTKLEPGWMLSFLVVSFCLAISAFYELLEWWIVILFYPEAGAEWLGHQGDPWDAQGDMLMALIGAILSLLLFSRLQDRQIKSRAR